MSEEVRERRSGAAPRRVVVLRALQLGDLLCAVPTFRAMRSAWPDAEIVLVGLPWASAFVARFPHYLDGFREFPGYPGLPERRPLLDRIPAFLAEIQAERFDLAIQLHGSGPVVNEITSLLGAGRSAGFFLPSDYRPDGDRDRFLPWPETGLEIHRLLAICDAIGVDRRGDDLEFPLTGDDSRALRAIPEARHLRPGSYVCLHPGASVAERRWPSERFAAVGDALADRGLEVVLTGTASEKPLTGATRAAMRSPALDLAGRTDLGTVGALIDGARLLVANDTGVSHIAAALRVPSVIISTGDNPARWAPIDASRHRVLCRESGVPEAEAIAHAEDLLGHTNTTYPPAPRRMTPSCGLCAS